MAGETRPPLNMRVEYGQYSLAHWVKMMLKGELTLAPCQRNFVWQSSRGETLMNSFERKLFVPPVTIIHCPDFENDSNEYKNFILDGQQRLTSVLLYALDTWVNLPSSENILEKIQKQYVNSKPADFEDDVWKLLGEELYKGERKNVKDILKNNYMGFCYLVAESSASDFKREISEMFVRINSQGVGLSDDNLREALYWVNTEYRDLFQPKLDEAYKDCDFCKCLALVSEYVKSNGHLDIAKYTPGGLKAKESKVDSTALAAYSRKYIEFIVGVKEPEEEEDKAGNRFEPIPQKWKLRIFVIIKYSNKILKELEKIAWEPSSISEADFIMFGLVYHVLFKGKYIDDSNFTELADKLSGSIRYYSESKKPNGATKLKKSIRDSINVYSRFIM